MNIKQSRKEVEEHMDRCIQVLDGPNPKMSTFWWVGFALMATAGAFTAINGVTWLGTLGWIVAMGSWYKIGTLTQKMYKLLVASSALKVAILHLAMEARERGDLSVPEAVTEEVSLH